MPLTALLYVDDQRRSERKPLLASATVRGGTVPYDAIVHDISADGCLIECSASLPTGSSFSIGIAGIGRMRASVVRSNGALSGCVFDRLLSRAEMEIAGAVTTVHALPTPYATPGRIEVDQVVRWPVRTRLAILSGGIISTWLIIALCLA